MSSALGEGAPFTQVEQDGIAETLTYTLPNAGRFDIDSVVAMIDNSAGPDIQPILYLAAPNGEIIAKKVQSETIPAGDSGSATWALRLADSAAAAAAGIASLPTAYVERNASNQTLVKNAQTVCVFDTFNANDHTVFAGLDGTNTNLLVSEPGEYLCLARIEFNVINNGTHRTYIIGSVDAGGLNISRTILSDLAGQETPLSSTTFSPMSIDTFTYFGTPAQHATFGVTFQSLGAAIDATGKARLQVIRLGDVATP